MKRFLSVLLFIFPFLIFSQGKSTINHFDKKGNRQGRWEFYSDDADTQISSKGKFKHGEQKGTWKYFRKDGTMEKKERVTLFGKKLITTMYHPNGRIYKKGKAVISVEKVYVHYYWYGKWKCYDEQGKLVKIEIYEKGDLVREEVLTISHYR